MKRLGLQSIVGSAIALFAAGWWLRPVTSRLDESVRKLSRDIARDMGCLAEVEQCITTLNEPPSHVSTVPAAEPAVNAPENVSTTASAEPALLSQNSLSNQQASASAAEAIDTSSASHSSSSPSSSSSSLISTSSSSSVEEVTPQKLNTKVVEGQEVSPPTQASPSAGSDFDITDEASDYDDAPLDHHLTNQNGE